MINVLKKNKFSIILIFILICSIFFASYLYKKFTIDNNNQLQKLITDLKKEKSKALNRFEINDKELLKEYNRLKKELALTIKGNLNRNHLINIYDPEELYFVNQKNNSATFEVNFQKILAPHLTIGKHDKATASAYIEIYDDKFFMITGNGFVSYIQLDEINNLDKKLIKMKSINTNIFDLINYREFYKESKFGIKDLLIFNNKIYISYSNLLKDYGYGRHHDNCYNTSILVANLNFDKLNFEKFYTPKDCASKKNDYGFFNPHHSGGRMVNLKDKIIFTHGDYKIRKSAQDDKSEFGKIIEINQDGTFSRFLSKGHRNPQGLYFDNENNILLSTEHGPDGGDEVNIVEIDNNEIINYGWPIVSYGKFYLNDVRENIENPKSNHSEFGFEEPLKYYTPSIGASQIIGKLKITQSNNNFYIVTSMGDVNTEYQTSLYILETDETNKLISEHQLKIDERIRDIIKYKKEFYLFLENSPSIGIITFK